MVIDFIYCYILHQSPSGEDLRLCREVCRKAMRFLQTMERDAHPGIVYKRFYGVEKGPEINVLNGDAMVAKAYACASVILLEPCYLNDAKRYITHLVNRFSAHYCGWWPYSESLIDGRVVPSDRPGRSVFFQSMIVSHLAGCVDFLADAQLEGILRQAAETVNGCMDGKGNIFSWAESRFEFIDKANIPVLDCLLLQDNATSLLKVERRLQVLDLKLKDPCDPVSGENTFLADDMWGIWFFSDTARMYLRLLRNQDSSSLN
jgi:regulator of RNase E activity RraB